jgi:hypothetical protein
MMKSKEPVQSFFKSLFAGAFTTFPEQAKREPWHGQSNVFSESFSKLPNPSFSSFRQPHLGPALSQGILFLKAFLFAS